MNSVMEIGDHIIYMFEGDKEWEGNNTEIIFSKSQKLNDFIFASEFLRDAKDMRMLEVRGKIDNDRNMDELLNKPSRQGTKLFSFHHLCHRFTNIGRLSTTVIPHSFMIFILAAAVSSAPPTIAPA
jgi:hypothetical protein